MKRGQTPPRDLRLDTRRWWKEIVEGYELESSHLRLLTLCARAWDRGEQARQVLRTAGLTFVDGHGVRRARPEVIIERNAWIAFSRLLRELRLDVSPPDDRPRRLGER